MAKELVSQIQQDATLFIREAKFPSKAAHRRARGVSLSLEKLLKAYRKASIAEDKQGE